MITPPSPSCPAILALFGDHLARSERVPAGLHGALTARLGRLVLDMTVAGGAREVYRSLPSGLLAARGLANITATPILLVGATDARGGGPTPAAFVDQVELMVVACYAAGAAPVVVLSPVPPPEVKALRGYGRGSRRWLARVEPVLRARLLTCGVELLHPELLAEHFADSLSLRPAGARVLATQIAGHIDLARQRAA